MPPSRINNGLKLNDERRENCLFKTSKAWLNANEPHKATIVILATDLPMNSSPKYKNAEYASFAQKISAANTANACNEYASFLVIGQLLILVHNAELRG